MTSCTRREGVRCFVTMCDEGRECVENVTSHKSFYAYVTSLENSKRKRVKYSEHYKFLDNELSHFLC